MASLNNVQILGNLGHDIDLGYTQAGKAACTLRVATHERWKDREGDTREHTEWHSVAVFGPQAEHCARYLHKGSQVLIEGRLRTREWEDEAGNKRYTTEVVARRVQFLSSSPRPNEAPGESQESFDESDIPF